MNGTDILITAVEGGIGYWAKVHEYEPDRARAFAVITDAEDPDNPTAYTITACDLTRAAKRVREQYPHTAGARAIAEDDIDGEAADMIFQVAVFGEVVYG